MESIFPILVVCLLPMVTHALAFLAGRWSSRHSIRIERRGDYDYPATAHSSANSPYHLGYPVEEERYAR